MPVSKEDWEDGDPAISNRELVLNFLNENPSKAYSADEVLDEFASLTEDDHLASAIVGMYYRLLLDHLSAEGKVEERMFEKESDDKEGTEWVSYYRARTDSTE